jgi:glycosyltransferase involved in cell wall biosynthesis
MGERSGRQSAEPLIVLVQASKGMRGPQKTVVEFATWLAGHREVVLAAPDGWVLRQARAAAPGIRTLTLPGDRAADRLAGARALLSVASKRPVIFHANGLSALNLVGGPALIRSAPVLVHFHAFKLAPRERAIASSWMKLGLRARFHGVSDFARGLLESTALRPAVGSVLPNPFNAQILAVERTPSEGPFRVGFVGGSDPRKGLRRLVEMAGLCADLDVEWRIFGVTSNRYDSYVDDCRAAAARLGIAERLRWLGSPADPQKLFGSVDAVVVASELESFCRVAVEAMMAGLPVVATRIPGLSEVVWDGVTGLMFDPADPSAGAEHIRRLATDSALVDQLGAAAQAGAMRYDIHQVGPRLERLYRALEGRAADSVDGPDREAVSR